MLSKPLIPNEGMHNKIEMLDALQFVAFRNFNFLFCMVWYFWSTSLAYNSCIWSLLFSIFCIQLIHAHLSSIIVTCYVKVLSVNCFWISSIPSKFVRPPLNNHWFKCFFLSRSCSAWYISTHTVLLSRNFSPWSIEPWCA